MARSEVRRIAEIAEDRHAVRRGGLGTLETSSNSRNLSRDTLTSTCCCNASGGEEVRTVGFGFRSAVVVLALTSASLVSSPGWAGDDGAAPLWQGIGSIFAPVVGFTGLGGGEKPPPIDYREHGKLVLPPNAELPPPGSAASADPANTDAPMNFRLSIIRRPPGPAYRFFGALPPLSSV